MRPITAAFLCLLTCVTVQGQASETVKADRLFVGDRLIAVDIKIAGDDWATLCSQSRDFGSALQKTLQERPFTYFDADVTVDGVAMKGVRVRKKGFIGSLDAERPSLKVRFSKGHPVEGIDRLTLNNNKQDRSLISQYLGYRLYAAAGLPAPRCGFARVTVNGRYLGVYSNVEAIRKPFLKRSFGDDSGALFEGTVADFIPDRLQRLELKNAAATRAGMEPLAKLLARPETDLEALAELVDIDSFMKFWAMESLTGFWDGYANNQNNYFVYQNPADARLVFIPWGLDDAFTDVMPIPPYRLKIKSVHGNAALPVRLYAHPKTRALYRKTLEEFMQDIWKEEELAAELDRLEDLLKDSTPRAQGDFPKALRRVRGFISKRRRTLSKELDRWPVELRAEPRTPVYFAVVGTASGTFSTKWNETAPEDPLSNGEATVSLTVDGKEVRFAKVGVSAERSTMGEGDPKPPAVVVTGKTGSGGKRLILGMGPEDPRAFRPSSEGGVKGGGILLRTNFFGAPDWNDMSYFGGRLWFEKASTEPGAPVIGRFEMVVTAMKGGK